MPRSQLIFCVLLIVGCLALLLTTRYYDHEYAKAHGVPWRTTDESADKVDMHSPQYYCDLAQLSAGAAALLSLIALVCLFRTKFLLWVPCFILCAILALMSLMTLKTY